MSFARIGQFKAKDGTIDELCRTYAAEAIPAIRAAKGNVRALLMRPHQPENDFLAITIRMSREDAERYDQSGQAQKMVDKIRHMFAGPPKLITYEAYGLDEC
jgi:quinol monooxygenase YgiN